MAVAEAPAAAMDDDDYIAQLYGIPLRVLHDSPDAAPPLLNPAFSNLPDFNEEEEEGKKMEKASENENEGEEGTFGIVGSFKRVSRRLLTTGALMLSPGAAKQDATDDAPAAAAAADGDDGIFTADKIAARYNNNAPKKSILSNSNRGGPSPLAFPPQGWQPPRRRRTPSRRFAPCRVTAPLPARTSAACRGRGARVGRAAHSAQRVSLDWLHGPYRRAHQFGM
jgi:hypothetical protein